ERSRPGAYPLFLYPARPTAALHALSLHDALPIFEFIEKLLKLWTNIMNGQFAGFIAGNASDHIFQRMIGSQLIASPGNGCNLERRNSAVRSLINLPAIKVVPEPLTLHTIRLLARRNVCCDAAATS